MTPTTTFLSTYPPRPPRRCVVVWSRKRLCSPLRLK